MNGDFTRITFDPAKNFSRVLMQQGRVQLDADWNEQASILLHYLRTLAADVLGLHAGPADAMGFGFITEATLKEWEEAGELETRWQGIEPNEARRKVLKEAVEDGRDAVITAGRYYVHGVLVENHRPILYTEQAGYPFSSEMALENLRNEELVAYLDVWERHITHVQDEHIREVALGGADTCTRAQVVWQVKTLVLDNNEEEFSCDSVKGLAREKPPKLRARARRGTPSPESCSVPPESQYRGLENHLYRVEVHQVGADVAGGYKGKKTRTPATFKWSRDNGSVVFPIVWLTGTTVVVTSLGKDHCSLLKPGDWVEVCDDDLALREQSGTLARVDAVDRDELKVTLKWPNGIVDPPSYAKGATPVKHPLLRRWDHSGDLAAYHGALPILESTTPDEGWVELEDGVQIWFAEGGEYRVGDYWLIPARVATGDIEWPPELDSNGMPMFESHRTRIPAERPPHGPLHYYAPLFHAKPGEAGVDCRCPFDTFCPPKDE